MARLAVKVVPRAERSEIVGWLGDSLRVRVAAAPEKGRANAAVVELLAETLGLARQQIRVASGHTGTRKLIEIDGIDASELGRRLPPRVDV